jgi:hypothetical protein
MVRVDSEPDAYDEIGFNKDERISQKPLITTTLRDLVSLRHVGTERIKFSLMASNLPLTSGSLSRLDSKTYHKKPNLTLNIHEVVT